jgi:hypothetical protein
MDLTPDIVIGGPWLNSYDVWKIAVTDLVVFIMCAFLASGNPS